MKTLSVGWIVNVEYEYEKYFFNLRTRVKSRKYLYTIFTTNLNTNEQTYSHFYAMHKVSLLREKYK